MTKPNDCCTNQFGYTIVPPILLTLFATAFSWIALLGCGFFEVKGLEGYPNPHHSYQIGLARLEDWKTNTYPFQAPDEEDTLCYNYENHSHFGTSDLDAPMQIARAMGIITCLLAVAVLVVLLVLVCITGCCCNAGTVDRRVIKLLAFTMFVMSLLSFLLLVALASDFCRNATQCDLGYAGVMSIVAAFIWAAAACSMMVCVKDRHPIIAAIEEATEDNDEPVVPEATVVEVIPTVFPTAQLEPSAPPEYKVKG